MDGFDAYKIYLALRLHFTSSYDAVKYNFQTNANEDKFRNMPVAYWFNKLARKYEKKDLIDAFVAQFVAGQKWGGMGDKDFEERYLAWKKRTDSLSYNFEQDLKTCRHWMESSAKINDPILADLFVVHNNAPLVHNLLLIRKMSIETFTVLDILTGFSVKCQDKVKDTILWPKTVTLINNYKPFLSFDRDACKAKLLEIFPLEHKDNG